MIDLSLAGRPRKAPRASSIRARFSIRTLLLTVSGTMAAVLVATFTICAVFAFEKQSESHRLLAASEITRDLFASMKYLRIERGTVNAALAANLSDEQEAQRDIVVLRAKAAERFAAAVARAKAEGFSDALALKSLRPAQMQYAALRRETDAALTLPRALRPTSLRAAWIDGNNALVNAIDDAAEHLPSDGDGFASRMMLIKRLAWLTSDGGGMDRLIIAEAIANGQGLSPDERVQIASESGRIVSPWKLIKDQARLGHLPAPLARVVERARKTYFTDVCLKRKAIISALSRHEQSPYSYVAWLEMSKNGLNQVMAVADEAVDLASADAANEAQSATRTFYASILGVVVFLGFGLFTVFFVNGRVVGPMGEIARNMRSVAMGNLSHAVPYQERGDEIGELARALGVFRANAIEKKRMEIELIHSKEAAEASSRTKSQFLANMSHELRTPLNAIIGFAEMMGAETFGALGSPRYKEYAEVIRSSGAHLLGLINDVLDLSRLDAGQTELVEDELDIEDVVATSVTMVARQASDGQIAIECSVPKGLPRVLADRRRVRQVLINLLANAVKFTPPLGRIKIEAHLAAGGLSISVSDTGIGIAKDDIPKALERFGQVDSKLARKYEGAGLGLPLAKQLMELHGGTLALDSELDTGTTVIVTFPPSRLITRAFAAA